MFVKMPPISAEERPVSTTGRSVSNIGLSFGLELVLRCHLVGGLLERLRGLQEISGSKNIVLLPCSAVGGGSLPPCPPPPGGAAPVGVTLDQSLTWDRHISSVVRRCNGILVSLNRFRRHFTTEALITIIQAHVFSQIIYCLPVWGGAAEKELQRIQKVINFAARVVTGARRRDHYNTGSELASLVTDWRTRRGA